MYIYIYYSFATTHLDPSICWLELAGQKVIFSPFFPAKKSALARLAAGWLWSSRCPDGGTSTLRRWVWSLDDGHRGDISTLWKNTPCTRGETRKTYIHPWKLTTGTWKKWWMPWKWRNIDPNHQVLGSILVFGGVDNLMIVIASMLH